MKNKITLLLLTILLVVTLSGCNQNSQLHERLLVQGIGIDKVEDGYLVTMHVFNVASALTEEDIKQTQVISEKGRSVSDALTNITNQTGKLPLYSQNLVIIIGEKTAADGISNIMDFFIRYYEARPSVNVFVSRDSAFLTMNCKNGGKLISASEIAELARTEQLSSNLMSSNVLNFVGNMYSKTSEPSCGAISIETIEEDQVIKSDGTAMFYKDKLVGFLNKEETKGAILLTKNAKNLTEVINVNNVGGVTCSIIKSSNKIDVDIVKNKPVFYITIKVQADIYEIDNAIYSTLGNQYFDVISDKIELTLKRLVEQAINTAIIKNKTDIFDFGKHLLNKQTDYFRTIENDWTQNMDKCEYHVNVMANINNSGQEANPV